jgi:Polyketide cyclase / dehydrase and lipid transport
MGIDVWSDTVEIERPSVDVTAYAFEPDNDPRWISGVSQADLETPRPIAVGSRVRRVASFRGRRIDYVMEVRELTSSRMHMHAIESPFPMEVTYEFEPAGERTLARIRVRGQPEGLYRLASPLIGRQVRSSVTGDLRSLKQILEAPTRA